MSTYPPIPYGWADFATIRRERALYVDKTLERNRDLFPQPVIDRILAPPESVSRPAG